MARRDYKADKLFEHKQECKRDYDDHIIELKATTDGTDKSAYSNVLEHIDDQNKLIEEQAKQIEEYKKFFSTLNAFLPKPFPDPLHTPIY